MVKSLSFLIKEMKCTNAIAMFRCKSDDCIEGSVRFHQCPGEGTHVNIDLYNFKPNQTHAIHIHEYGDESNGCISLGGHWNPLQSNHGSRSSFESHAGDMINNLTSDKDGRFRYTYYDSRIKLCGNIDDSIIGRSVVIHDGIDDLGLGGLHPYNAAIHKESLKTGNAGKRLACAIIGRAKDGSI